MTNFYHMLIDGLESWGLFIITVCFFISCLSLILEVPIHCRESIGGQVMWKQVKSVIMKNQLIYIVDNLRMSTFSVNVLGELFL